MMIRSALRFAAPGSRLMATGNMPTTHKIGSSLSHRAMSTNAVMNPGESIQQKVLRWVDVTGFMTMWYSRKAWVMDIASHDRAAAVMVTEYERRLFLFLACFTVLFYPICFWYWYGAFNHMACKPICPQMAWGTNGRLEMEKLWISNSLIASQCKQCRWLDFECKKICYDKLAALGYNLWGLQLPRTQTVGFH